MSRKVEFHRVLPSCLGFIPHKAIEYLDRAVKKSPANDITVLDALAHVRSGTGDIYLAYRDDLCGTFFLMCGKGNNGKILDVVLLGGDDFMSWRNEVKEFTINLAKSMGCNQVWIVGREGWGHVFPDMEPIGTVYCLRVG